MQSNATSIRTQFRGYKGNSRITAGVPFVSDSLGRGQKLAVLSAGKKVRRSAGNRYSGRYSLRNPPEPAKKPVIATHPPKREIVQTRRHNLQCRIQRRGMSERPNNEIEFPTSAPNRIPSAQRIDKRCAVLSNDQAHPDVPLPGRYGWPLHSALGWLQQKQHLRGWSNVELRICC